MEIKLVDLIENDCKVICPHCGEFVEIKDCQNYPICPECGVVQDIT